MTESLPTTTTDTLMPNIVGPEMAECMKTNTTGHGQETDTEEADHHANDIHLLRMVNHKSGHLHRSTCASANITFGKIGTGRHIAAMNS